MNKTTTVSALFLAGAMLVSSSNMSAAGESPNNPVFVQQVQPQPRDIILSTRAQAAIVAMLPVVAGWILLYSRKSEKEFTTRFDASKVTKASKLFSKDGLKNLWYFVADELIGQRKQSSTLKCKDGKVFPSEETPAYGVLGNIDATAAPLAEAATKFTAPFTGLAALWLAVQNGAIKVAKHSERVV